MQNKLKIETGELYEQIYKNALEDRDKAITLYDDLAIAVTGSPESHALQGVIIAKYLERMSASNTQLLKMLEIRQNADIASQKHKKQELTDEEKKELFSSIQNENNDE